MVEHPVRILFAGVQIEGALFAEPEAGGPGGLYLLEGDRRPYAAVRVGFMGSLLAQRPRTLTIIFTPITGAGPGYTPERPSRQVLEIADQPILVRMDFLYTHTSVVARGGGPLRAQLTLLSQDREAGQGAVFGSVLPQLS